MPLLYLQDTINCLQSVLKEGWLFISTGSTEDCKLVVRLQMQNTLGIVAIGQLDE